MSCSGVSWVYSCRFDQDRLCCVVSLSTGDSLFKHLCVDEALNTNWHPAVNVEKLSPYSTRPALFCSSQLPHSCWEGLQAAQGDARRDLRIDSCFCWGQVRFSLRNLVSYLKLPRYTSRCACGRIAPVMHHRRPQTLFGCFSSISVDPFSELLWLCGRLSTPVLIEIRMAGVTPDGRLSG